MVQALAPNKPSAPKRRIMFLAFSFAVFLTFASSTYSQVIARGSCNATVQSDFDVHGHLGVWYVVSEIPDLFEKGDTCQRTENVLLTNGVLQINETSTKLGTLYMENVGTAVVPDTNQAAKYVLTYDRGHGLTAHIPYWILKTDSVNYAVVYSCKKVDNERRLDLAWILSRTVVLDPKFTREIQAVFVKNQIDFNALKPNPQKHCRNY